MKRVYNFSAGPTVLPEEVRAFTHGPGELPPLPLKALESRGREFPGDSGLFHHMDCHMNRHIDIE